ncbi:plasmid pRiA4b ORF-3 family protein [Paracraurococcus lichenis]|uniref:Plasmid pRiA4b ORF-3 family protein n=1 Tax=Paracraurococcus lichenis TaxID=3064888 RepID=A0ABT9E8L3_9PROT|nr:plasmid pRiA4b ORF-3 family protein [Paracraurococcus sp. LOR1-02]MDO9712524.1 plasmid pRiA4b ORF-3 family protein [Paracraurococcus sp. LOR1-02]
MAKTAQSTSGVNRKVVSLKVTLRDTKPPIWRRLLVPGATTLGDLHRAIQAAMGWDDCHLHTFDIEGRQYGDRRTVDDVADENRVTLNGLTTSGVTRFAYTYDFGDNWQHAIVIEKSPPAVEALSRPVCTAGKRRGPPEDCGGPWGYRELLDILADPAHPEHAERFEWLGDDFDPEDFSPAIADAILAARFGHA